MLKLHLVSTIINILSHMAVNIWRTKSQHSPNGDRLAWTPR